MEEAASLTSTLQMGLLRRYHLGGITQQDSSRSSSVPDEVSSSTHKVRNSALDYSPLFGAFHPYTPISFTQDFLSDSKPRRTMTHPLSYGSNYTQRKIRGEKKAIPEEQKDGRYYERRKRNNQAAKKSRDARKLREDQIALRAALLEHENAMMRAQILTLREETQALREMLLLSNKATDHDRTAALLPAILRTPFFKTPDVASSKGTH